MSTNDFKRRQVSGRGIPVPGNDIDTDRIIPARFVTFNELGKWMAQDFPPSSLQASDFSFWTRSAKSTPTCP